MIETKTPKKKQKRYIGTRVVFDYFLSNTAIFKYLGILIEQFAANKIHCLLLFGTIHWPKYTVHSQ